MKYLCVNKSGLWCLETQDFVKRTVFTHTQWTAAVCGMPVCEAEVSVWVWVCFSSAGLTALPCTCQASILPLKYIPTNKWECLMLWPQRTPESIETTKGDHLADPALLWITKTGKWAHRKEELFLVHWIMLHSPARHTTCSWEAGRRVLEQQPYCSVSLLTVIHEQMCI